MTKRDVRTSLLVVICSVMVTLSCVSSPGEAPPWVAADDELHDLNRTACDGTPSLVVTSTITKQETNQFGTQMCEYTLTFRNSNPERDLWIHVFQHDQDGYAGTEDSQWMGNILLGANEEENWFGYVYIYEDEDASGPVMAVPEKMAGVYADPECSEENQDLNFLELISVPLEAVCPRE
jgi:hypothetical protein